jgi:hypothetical protein
MAMAELREAVRLLARMPLLWIPGMVAGIFAAVLWLILMFSGTFFAGRLLVISGLVLLFFITGMFSLIKNDGGDIRSMLAGGRQYYFRVLLPLLVILFMILLVFVLVVLTLTLVGTTPDPSLIVFLSFGVMIPSIILTFFSDTAAVFEDRKVFDSIQRSIEMVSVNISQAIAFFFTTAVVGFGIIFGLMVIWEALLYDKLEPVTHYSEAQLQAFTPDKLLAIIGTDGIWITAGILFIAGLVLIPIVFSYKACFFKKFASKTVVIQQITGEYDSKGRWYKY